MTLQQRGSAFAQMTELIAVVRTVDELRAMFRECIASLRISYETADTIAGLPAGHF